MALTRSRDDYRRLINETDAGLTALGFELAKLKEQENSGIKQTDETVTQVFALNEVVVGASSNRADYLTRQIFPRLLDDNGKPLSQVSFTSSNGLRRVVAMTNTMTIVQPDMAAQAMSLIQRFFDRFQRTTGMDKNSKALYELTRQLLVEKTSFKVGPDLYRFIGMELDGDIFPELAEAQHLLRGSIRSEKTSSYIRLYQRTSRTDQWVDVKQS